MAQDSTSAPMVEPIPKIELSYNRMKEMIAIQVSIMFKRFEPHAIAQSFPQIAKQNRFSKESIHNLFKQLHNYGVRNAMLQIDNVLKEMDVKNSLETIDALNMRKEIFSDIGYPEGWKERYNMAEEIIHTVDKELNKKFEKVERARRDRRARRGPRKH